MEISQKLCESQFHSSGTARMKDISSVEESLSLGIARKLEPDDFNTRGIGKRQAHIII